MWPACNRCLYGCWLWIINIKPACKEWLLILFQDPKCSIHLQQLDGQLVPIDLVHIAGCHQSSWWRSIWGRETKTFSRIIGLWPDSGNLTLLPPLQPYLLQNAIGRSTRPNRTCPNYTRHQKEGRQRLSLSLVRDPIPPVLSSFLPGTRAAEQLGG